jgi:hypothetical protein
MRLKIRILSSDEECKRLKYQKGQVIKTYQTYVCLCLYHELKKLCGLGYERYCNICSLCVQHILYFGSCTAQISVPDRQILLMVSDLDPLIRSKLCIPDPCCQIITDLDGSRFTLTHIV